MLSVSVSKNFLLDLPIFYCSLSRILYIFVLPSTLIVCIITFWYFGHITSILIVSFLVHSSLFLSGLLVSYRTYCLIFPQINLYNKVLMLNCLMWHFHVLEISIVYLCNGSTMFRLARKRHSPTFIFLFHNIILLKCCLIPLFVHYSQAYFNIIAGACMAIGLRFAGSCNSQAFETLLHYCNMVTRLTSRSIAELAGKSTIEACLNVLICSLAMVCITY